VTRIEPTFGLPLLVEFVYWLRDRILATSEALTDEQFQDSPASNGRDLRETLVHELDVEIGWRRRLRGEPEETWNEASTLDPNGYANVDDVRAHWMADEAEMRAWIASLTPTDLDRAMTIGRLDGHRLGVYLLHMLEHGVQQLTVASAILTEMGHSPGDIEILDALDDLAPAAAKAPDDEP